MQMFILLLPLFSIMFHVPGPAAAMLLRRAVKSVAGPVEASGATSLKVRQIASNRAALPASKGESCKRCDACGNSPDSDTGSNFSLNSGSAATSSEYRYRVPKSAIERSQSWRKPRCASSSMARSCRPSPRNAEIGRRARYRSCCGGRAPR
jgi:hypothetical protein